MKNRKLVKYINKQLHSIHENAAIISLKYNAHAIHQLRVNYKKLRTATRLINFANKGNELKMPRQIKKIYRNAGAVRDKALYQKNIRTNCNKQGLNIPGEYFSILRNTHKKSLATLKKYCNKLSLKKITEKLKGRLDSKITHHHFKDFREQKLDAIHLLVAGRVSASELHAIRKLFKDVMYALALVRNKKHIELEKITDLLGKFNDLNRCLAFSKNINEFVIPVQEKQTIKKIRTEWMKMKADIKRNVLGMMPKVVL